MNIIHVSDIDIRSNAGGMNTVIPELIKRQIEDVPIISNTLFITKRIDALNSSDLKFNIISMNDSYLRSLRNADLLIFHSVYNIKFIFLSYLCIIYNIPYIIVSHGGLSKVALNKGFLKKRIFKFFCLDFFVKKSASLCFTSEEEQLNSAYLNKRYIVVPNPILLTDHAFRFEDFNPNSITIIFLSKIDFYYKGLDVLLDAFSDIKEYLTHRNVFVHFYGYGNNKDINIQHIDKKEKDILSLISRIESLGLKERAFYHGPIFGDKKMDILHKSDIYILPSRSEAMPLSITEAFSVGTPCIITPGTNMTTILKQYNAGWISSLNRKDLAATIKLAVDEYIKTPKKFRKGARAAFEYINTQNIGREAIKKYKEILTS